MSLGPKIFNKNSIKLKEYIINFKPTFIQVNNERFTLKDLPEKYLDYYIDWLELIPNGGIIHLNTERLLKDYLKQFKDNSPTFVKINDKLVHYKNVEKEYLTKVVDRLELVPNGGVIYLKENNYEN